MDGASKGEHGARIARVSANRDRTRYLQKEERTSAETNPASLARAVTDGECNNKQSLSGPASSGQQNAGAGRPLL